MPKPVAEKLAPAPNTRSDSATQTSTARDMVGPPEPSASGCVSSKALLPSRLEHTGASSSSATAFSSSQALAVVHALPRVDQRILGGDQRRGGGIDILRDPAR